MGKKKISLNNPLFVNLISTMIGIIAGLYITSYFQENKLYDAKEKALIQVKQELHDNYSMLKDFHQKVEEKYEPIAIIASALDANMNLVIPKDSLQVFREQTSIIFDYASFTAVDDTLIQLHGDFNVFIESPLMAKKLSSLVWNSYKQTDFLSITSFKCITDVEAFYVLQKEANAIKETWKDQLFQMSFARSAKSTEDFVNNWRVLLLKQKLLLDYYQSIDAVLNNCE
ncbi:hypothetical protein [uncultured Kordia sp.]|uniref:hypothetical protein n=1 Tax=uncultured Kordia sp. TaxID=507699 RepID=UPI0026168F06|nr:hypothetical protein [uncultured Kordia sp.]